MKRSTLYSLVITLLLAGFCSPAFCGDLQSGFRNPPHNDRPGIILYRSGGDRRQVTTEGMITKTLDSYAGQGIGSILLGQLNDMGAGDECHLSTNWIPRLAHFGKESKRLGLTTGIFIAPGWSNNGGPWIPLSESQQQLSYEKIRVSGPRKLDVKLPVPEDHNLSMGKGLRYAKNEVPDDYRDIAVCALRLPPCEAGDPEQLAPVVTGADGTVVLSGGTNTDGSVHLDLRSGPAKTADIILKYDRPVAVRSLYMLPDLDGDLFPREGDIQASANGTDYSRLAAFRFPPESSLTVNFPETTAKYFKIRFRNTQRWNGWNGKALPAEELNFRQISLIARPLVNHVEWKNGDVIKESYLVPTPPFQGIPVSDVINLTAQMSTNGVLSWDVPPGDWLIIRMGHRFNRKSPHPVGGHIGYMADPLSPRGIQTHFNAYVKPYTQRIGDVKRLNLDSWESGVVNWTPDLPQQFQNRRGYDITPYLPVLAGEIIRNSDVSERFLTDFRRTIADLLADNHYGESRRQAEKLGMSLSAQSGPGGGIDDQLMNFGRVDIPHTEFWIDSNIDGWAMGTKIAASAKRAYGKERVGAESFDTWQYFREYPFTLKQCADVLFCSGLNHCEFHVGFFQPEDVGAPGKFETFGSFFNFHNTYWSRFHVFTDYLSRCQYLLSKGVFQADILYYAGDKPRPNNMHAWIKSSPKGYDFDFINTECLLDKLGVENGSLVLGETHYRLLVLPDEPDMRVGVAEKIKSLVGQGASVLGPPPQRAEGLQDYPANDAKVQAIAAELWDSPPASGGRVFSGGNVAEALNELNIAPDVIFESSGTVDFRYIHNREGQRDIYFISSQTSSWQSVTVSFRLSGKAPSLWNPADGSITPVSVYSDDGTRTCLSLNMEPSGSAFVVFDSGGGEHFQTADVDGRAAVAAGPAERSEDSLSLTMDHGTVRLLAFKNGKYDLKDSRGNEISAVVRGVPPPLDLSGSWSVSFNEKSGIGTKTYQKLVSWTEDPDERVKYYSGEAVYEKSFDLTDKDLSASDAVLLDLGLLDVMGEVYLNGEEVGILWKPPYRLDVTKLVRSGRNELKVVVLNTWFNRLFYEIIVNPGGQHLLDLSKAPSAEVIRNKIKSQSLIPSGLFGPVRLVFGTRTDQPTNWMEKK